MRGSNGDEGKNRTKHEFDRLDRLEEFRKAINYEAKLYCGVDEAFSREKAADFLQQLAKSWKMNEDDVIATTTQRVRGTIDKQLRNYVLRFLNVMKIPFSEEKIKERWEALSDAEKNEVVDGVISYLQENKKHD